MFLDASAVIAILLDEPEAAGFIKAIEAAKSKIRVSPVVRLEATLELVRRRLRVQGRQATAAEDFTEAGEVVSALFNALHAKEILITPGISDEAARAMSIYSELAGHPAQLSMSDALSYACAKAFHVPLLYKGDKFSHTDLE